MSIKVSSYVWDHAPYRGSKLLVLLAFADAASDEGYCWPLVATIARRARIQERPCQQVISQLIKDGWLAREERKTTRGDNASNLWRITYPDAEGGGDQVITRGVITRSPGGDQVITRGVITRSPGGDQVITQNHNSNHQIEPSGDPSSPLAPQAPASAVRPSPTGGATAPQERAGKPAPSEKVRQERRDLFATFCAYLPAPTPRRAKSAWYTACADLHDAGATPDTLNRVIRAYQRRWPDAALTPLAIAKHWDLLLSDYVPADEVEETSDDGTRTDARRTRLGSTHRQSFASNAFTEEPRPFDDGEWADFIRRPAGWVADH